MGVAEDEIDTVLADDELLRRLARDLANSSASDSHAQRAVVRLLLAAGAIASYLDSKARRDGDEQIGRMSQALDAAWTAGNRAVEHTVSATIFTIGTFAGKYGWPSRPDRAELVAELDILLSGPYFEAGRELAERRGFYALQRARRARVVWLTLEDITSDIAGDVAMFDVVRRRPIDAQQFKQIDHVERSPTDSSPFVARPAESAPRSAPGNHLMRHPMLDPEPSAKVVRVWCGTNRIPVRGDFSFGPNRDDELHLGYCDVLVPEDHGFGTLGPGPVRALIFGENGRRVRVQGRRSLGASTFREMLGEEADDAAHDGSILVYVHGYRQTFNGAVLRAGQLAYDLRIRGSAAVFSWPSRNLVRGYFADQDRADASDNGLADYLDTLTRITGADKINIIAHSMGNRLLGRAMTLFAGRRPQVRLGVFVLAAPDVEVSLFRRFAALYAELTSATTLYVSDRDRALIQARRFQDSHRAGLWPPLTVLPALDTIDVSKIDRTVLGHGYFATEPPLLYDIRSVLDGVDVRYRQRLSPMEDPEYWILQP
ncbi:alpha/beta hydrolase [Paenarthrobacter sp. Z7-10]|uniref:alpha/beta hydrolase n=1 Tax=Paenarthrobacter sp. Z7-10 TaxID=2787635 RepID=UPI0022A9E471|nr:alpha/beta hydrolase [Paenarthrobacter sp. Z7-10]MCZ2404400.1 alpha/beta hydrolase [Paenarthrobacter sp. Z7-10]